MNADRPRIFGVIFTNFKKGLPERGRHNVDGRSTKISNGSIKDLDLLEPSLATARRYCMDCSSLSLTQERFAIPCSGLYMREGVHRKGPNDKGLVSNFFCVLRMWSPESCRVSFSVD